MSRRRKGRPLHGILLLDKPAGMSSNHALQRAKRLYQAQKAGHTGSLDPLATGMLPLCFGHATRVSAFLLDADKEYHVHVKLGERTDTADADGDVIETKPAPELTSDVLQKAAQQFVGNIQQVPPMYSALKRDGKRLYELARQGLEVDRPPRPATIYRIGQLEITAEGFACAVRCSKGTYIRSLVEDMAAALATVGHVTQLRRTAVAGFDGLPMITLDQLAEQQDQGAAIDDLLLPADAPLLDWPEAVLGADAVASVLHGQAVFSRVAVGLQTGQYIRLYDDAKPEERRFLGLATVANDGRLQPSRVFSS